MQKEKEAIINYTTHSTCPQVPLFLILCYNLIMKNEVIKGSCEHCGFAYKGIIIPGADGDFPNIKCPNCHQETHNFDEASIVDERDKVEHYDLDYKENLY